MENRSSQLRVLGLLACVLATLACALLFPSQARADSTDKPAWGTSCYVQDSSGNKKYYVNEQEAIDDACDDGKVVVLIRDDVFRTAEDALHIPEGKKVTINLNGHSLINRYGTLFCLNSDSTLMVQSSDPEGGADSAGQQFAAGVISNCSSEFGGGFLLKAGSHLSLDNVTLRDNESWQELGGGGAIYAENDCAIDLKNSLITNNTADNRGGAIYTQGDNCSITLDNSKISGNKAELGGGIFTDGHDTVINLKNGSTIDGNVASGGGGGVYCNLSYFTVKSSDGTGVISGNQALGSNKASMKDKQSGGGIHIDSKTGFSEGLIEGLAVSGNYSAYDGGGLELDQRWTTVRNCTITGNWCKYEGGGAYVCNSNVLIDNCTITGNSCNVDSGGNYEGGGVYVWCDYDLKLSGTCIVKGNTRGKDSGNADDVFLRENAGATAKAYITGNLAKGSTVGVRTGITDDRRIAKNFKSESKDCLFIDLDGYYVSYGSDDSGDAWQRHRSIEFLAQLNGEGSNRHKWNSSVTLVAPLTKDDKVFTRWDTGRTTGLNPIEDYIDGDQIFANALSFKMPQNDVNAVATYADKATVATINGMTPIAGQALPSTAEFSCGGLTGTASVTWYEVGGGESAISVASDASDGVAAASDTAAMVPVSGTAKEGAVYVASVTCFQSAKEGRCFSDSIDADDVTVKTDSGETKAAKASVDDDTGALTVVTKELATTADSEGASEAKTGKATVSAVTDGLALSSSASTHKTLESVEVTYINDGEDVTFSAPYVDGYNFCNWEDAPEGSIVDDEVGTVTVSQSALVDGLELTAVYTPVVTKVEFAANAPVNGGDELASQVTSLWLTCSDGERFDFAQVLKAESLGVDWSPESEDGKADFSTAHTAVIELSADTEGLVDIEKVVSTDAVAVAQNGVQAEAAGFTVRDGKLCLAIAFPATPDIKAVSIVQPDAVELTFDQAKACSELDTWPLPKTAVVKLEGDATAEGDITWQAVEGFDANATGAQELTVKGTVDHIAYDGELDDEGLSREVACTVKIAASSQGDDGGGADGNSNVDGSDNAGKGGKSALAKTGDSIPVFAVAGVAAVALIAAGAVSIAALRRRRI